MPAVANALVDTLSVLGIKHVEMPATPEVLRRAIHEVRGKSAQEERRPATPSPRLRGKGGVGGVSAGL
jgi:hypothetical protein